MNFSFNIYRGKLIACKTSVMIPANSLFQNKKLVFILFFFFTVAASLLSCQKNAKLLDVDLAFSKYVEEYTTGIVS